MNVYAVIMFHAIWEFTRSADCVTQSDNSQIAPPICRLRNGGYAICRSRNGGYVICRSRNGGYAICRSRNVGQAICRLLSNGWLRDLLTRIIAQQEVNSCGFDCPGLLLMQFSS